MPDKEWLYPNLHENGYTYSALENLHYIPHVHGGLECVYVLDGELCATIDEKNYTLKKGDICLIFPQVRHSYRTPNHSNIFCFALLHDTMPDDLRSLFVDGYALPNPIYWCLVTAAYLAWSFITMAWDRTWIVWPVAGVLFAAVVGIIRMTHKEGQKEKKAG